MPEPPGEPDDVAPDFVTPTERDAAALFLSAQTQGVARQLAAVVDANVAAMQASMRNINKQAEDFVAAQVAQLQAIDLGVVAAARFLGALDAIARQFISATQLGDVTVALPAAVIRREAPAGEVIVSLQHTSVATIEEAAKLTRRVVRRGFNGLAPVQVFVCLIYVFFTAAPVEELHLPPELQTLLSNEAGYLSLAIVIASAVWNHTQDK